MTISLIWSTRKEKPFTLRYGAKPVVRGAMLLERSHSYSLYVRNVVRGAEATHIAAI